MSLLSVNTFEQSESSKHSKIPRYTSYPSSPGSPSYTPNYATPVSPWGVTGSTPSLEPPTVPGSDGESDSFEDSLSALGSNSTPSHSSPSGLRARSSPNGRKCFLTGA